MGGSSSAFIGAGRTLLPRVQRGQVAAPLRTGTRLRRQSRLAINPVLNWIDLGNGAYKNLAAGYECRQGNLPGSFILLPSSGTAFGGCTKWPGTYQFAFINPGYAATCDGDSVVDPTMFVATNLSVLPAGAGNTFACSYIKTAAVANDWEWIWGRTGVSAGEAPANPFAYWAFVEGHTPDVDGQVSAWINSAGSQIRIGPTAVSIGAFNTFVCSTINTSSGSGTSSFYHNGVLVGTATGVSMFNPNPGTVAETLPQVGGNYHWDTGESTEAVAGSVPIGIFTAFPWTQDDAAFFHLHPGDTMARI